MRFIEKTYSPASLETWKGERISANQSLSYKDLDTQPQSDLKDLLILEQKGLCCYCQQVITKANSTIEHFLPQSKFKKHETEYLNLHLACNYSRGKGIKKENKYCDDKKGDDLIINVLLHSKCESFFRYTKNGEILPNDFAFKNLVEFNKNIEKLSLNNQAILHLINVLNLNTTDLITKRKKTINDMFKVFKKMTDVKKKGYLVKEEAKSKSSRFPSVVKYFIEMELKRLEKDKK